MNSIERRVRNLENPLKSKRVFSMQDLLDDEFIGTEADKIAFDEWLEMLSEDMIDE